MGRFVESVNMDDQGALPPRECATLAILSANIVFPLTFTPSMATSTLCRLRGEAIFGRNTSNESGMVI